MLKKLLISLFIISFAIADDHIKMVEGTFVANNGEVVIRPMMYLALSYDHRIIDGRESVGFLVAIKEALEDPINLLMDGDLNKSLEL